MSTKTNTEHPAKRDMLEFASEETIRPLTTAVQPAELEIPKSSDFEPMSMGIEVTQAVSPDADVVTEIATGEAPACPVVGQHKETSTEALAVAPPVAPVAEPVQTVPRRHRGANPAMDNVWSRHHAICVMGVICDVALGGYDAARAASEPLNEGVRRNTVADALLTICPWVENSAYLNFDGCSGLAKHGLRGHFKAWVANRVHHFYDKRKPSEHPVRRKKGNIGAVYKAFFDEFHEAVAARTIITEERAKEFWESVSDRVPFRSPEITATVG